MTDGNLANDLPDWWPYPDRCGNGHPWGPGRVVVVWRKCPCVDEPGSGHTIVRCRVEDCSSVWYRPRHDPDC